MRECAVRTDLNDFIPLLLVFGVTRTVFKPVKRTVTEKTVYFLDSLMAGVVFTFGILKKSGRVFHGVFSF